MQEQKNSLNQRIVAGDTNAFQDLYRLHYPSLCRFAFKYVSNTDLAEDLVQDSLMKVWEQRARLLEIDNLKSYLFLMVKNACLNHFEHQKVVAKHADAVVAEINILSLLEDNTAFENETPNLEDLVMQAIEQLPKQSGEVFKMKYVEGMRTKEIAEQTNLSPRTVETHVYNALKSLRAMFKDFNPFVILLIVAFFSKLFK